MIEKNPEGNPTADWPRGPEGPAWIMDMSIFDGEPDPGKHRRLSVSFTPEVRIARQDSLFISGVSELVMANARAELEAAAAALIRERQRIWQLAETVSALRELVGAVDATHEITLDRFRRLQLMYSDLEIEVDLVRPRPLPPVEPAEQIRELETEPGKPLPYAEVEASERFGMLEMD